MKFDGKGLAKKLETELIAKVANWHKRPKIVSFLVGNDPASLLFTRLKKEAAERVGVGFEVMNCELEELADKMKGVVVQDEVTGVMVQLPIPNVSNQELEEVLRLIPKEKDVDGLRYPESGVLPPVVAAVLLVLDEIAKSERDLWSRRFAVVGARGNVGRVVLEQLSNRGVEVLAVGREQTKEKILQVKVVISCVGKKGLITEEMIGDEVIVVDVGAPAGDISREAYKKAKVSVEVPGGVGPVTIACLMMSSFDLLRGFSPKFPSRG